MQSQTYKLTVVLDDAPVFSSEEVETVTEDMTYSYDISGYDEDGESSAMIFEAFSIPSFLTLTDYLMERRCFQVYRQIVLSVIMTLF